MTEEEIKQIKYEELKEEEQIISLETVKTLSNDIADKIKTLRDALEDQGLSTGPWCPDGPGRLQGLWLSRFCLRLPFG